MATKKGSSKTASTAKKPGTRKLKDDGQAAFDRAKGRTPPTRKKLKKAAKPASDPTPGIGHNSGAAGKANGAAAARARDARLEAFILRVETINEDIAARGEDRKQVFAEAKAAGYCTKTMRRIIVRRALTDEERDERDALDDLYSGALGMLGDTPLGEAAVRRLEKERREKAERARKIREAREADEHGEAGAGEAEDTEQRELFNEERPDPYPGVTVDAARTMGAAHFNEGKPIIANPFPARDPRRAAFDEGWCQAADSDGMEIPDALRPTSKKKGRPPTGAGDGDNSDGQGDAAGADGDKSDGLDDTRRDGAGADARGA
jgi:uncharacterized protein (UPF0335 family)